MDKVFNKPEHPFLLLTEDVDGNVSYHWWDNEDEIKGDAIERRECDERIICAIEISGCRNIDIPSRYTVEDFIEQVNEAYASGKEKSADGISIEIRTNAGKTYYINDTGDGFRCSGLDYLYKDIDSAAEELFNNRIIGKPGMVKVKEDCKLKLGEVYKWQEIVDAYPDLWVIATDIKEHAGEVISCRLLDVCRTNERAERISKYINSGITVRFIRTTFSEPNIGFVGWNNINLKGR